MRSLTGEASASGPTCRRATAKCSTPRRAPSFHVKAELRRTGSESLESISLADILTEELNKKELLGDAQDEFARLIKVQPVERVFDPDSFWRLPGARGLAASLTRQLEDVAFESFGTETPAATGGIPPTVRVRVVSGSLDVKLD